MKKTYEECGNSICTTPVACRCSSSGEECCCIWNRSGRCKKCGALRKVIDINTGEELPS